MDGQVEMFTAVTSTTPQQAQQYLALTDGNVEQAVELFFSNPDLGASATTPAIQPAQSAAGHDAITIDDDDDDDFEMTSSGPVAGHSLEDDEALARRLQQEMYGGGVRSGGAAGSDVDEDGVRAPMARTTETLVGPGSDWRDDPDEMHAAVVQQLAARRQHRGRGAAPGIFNQRETPSIWAGDDPSNPEIHRQVLSRATGGASEQTSKSTLLADLFRPPFDLIANMSWADARDEGKENEKWLLVNVQDPSIFDCQVLNRDIWKNPQIKDTVKENFIFLQYNKNDPRGSEYIQYYFAQMHDMEDAYPHVAIVDPRTGEQVKTWSGAPAPKPSDFLMDLHEFLDRYSLSMEKKNPVQAKRKEKKKDVAQMSEEEMLEMAMQNSLGGGGGPAPKEEDPDALTQDPNNKGKGPAVDHDAINTNGNTSTAKEVTPFSLIPSTNAHQEPTSTGPDTTRIQFRHSAGRVVRRFALADPVRRIYEWLKASPIAGKEGAVFELIEAMGKKNLIEMLDLPIGEAGLRNGTVMVEFVEEE